jgi:hypothetical protein
MFALGTIFGALWTQYLSHRRAIATTRAWIVAVARQEATVVANAICNVRVPPPSERATVELKPEHTGLPLEERYTDVFRHATKPVLDREAF